MNTDLLVRLADDALLGVWYPGVSAESMYYYCPW